MKKILAMLLVMLMAIMGGCTSQEPLPDEDVIPYEEQFEASTIVDAMGREVSIDSKPERVVCIGPGALRLYVYVNGTENLVGVENIDKEMSVDKTYLAANPDLMNLDTVGQGGPMNSPDAELLTAMAPDVIFTTYANSKEAVDQLQEQTGSKVIALSLGKVGIFEEDIDTSLMNIGVVTANKKRAETLIDYMKNIQADLQNRTKDVEKKKAYVGGIGFKGAKGLLSTRTNFNLFQAVNVEGYLDDNKEKAPIMVDKEKLLEIDPEIIFFDINGAGVAKQEYQEDSAFFDSLKAVKENKVYGLLSYNNYATNIDTAMLDAYYIGKTMYPEKFEDLKLEDKAKEIYETLLGKNVYKELLETQDGFKEYSLKGK